MIHITCSLYGVVGTRCQLTCARCNSQAIGINYNPCVISVAPRGLDVTAAGVNIQPNVIEVLGEGLAIWPWAINIQPALVYVNPWGADIR